MTRKPLEDRIFDQSVRIEESYDFRHYLISKHGKDHWLVANQEKTIANQRRYLLKLCKQRDMLFS